MPAEITDNCHGNIFSDNAFGYSDFTYNAIDKFVMSCVSLIFMSPVQ